MLPLAVDWASLGIATALLIVGGFAFVWLLGRIFGDGQTA